MPTPFFSTQSPLAGNANVRAFMTRLGIVASVNGQHLELDDQFKGDFLVDCLLFDRTGPQINLIKDVASHMLSVAEAGKQPMYQAEIQQIDALIGRLTGNRKHDAHALMKALFFTHPVDLETTLPKISGALVRLFPQLEIRFIKVATQAHSRLALIRMLYANERLPAYAGNTATFQGFQTLNAVESLAELGFGEWWNALFTLFSPFSFGLAVEQIGGAYIINLGELWDTTEFFPQRTVDLYRRDSTHFAESKLGETLPPRVPNTNFNSGQLNTLYQQHIVNANRLLKYILSPRYFIKPSGEIDGFRWYSSLLDWSRLITLSVYIQTEFLNNFYKKSLLFQSLDIVSNLIYINRTLRGLPEVSEEKIFLALLDSTGAASEVAGALTNYPAPFGNYFRNQTRRTMDDLVKGALDSIFVPGTFSGNRVVLGAESLTSIEYAKRLVRALRNTHHGYGLRSEPSNKVLAISTGSIPNSAPSYATSLVLATFADPELFFGSKIAV